MIIKNKLKLIGRLTKYRILGLIIICGSLTGCNLCNQSDFSIRTPVVFELEDNVVNQGDEIDIHFSIERNSVTSSSKDFNLTNESFYIRIIIQKYDPETDSIRIYKNLNGISDFQIEMLEGLEFTDQSFDVLTDEYIRECSMAIYTGIITEDINIGFKLIPNSVGNYLIYFDDFGWSDQSDDICIDFKDIQFFNAKINQKPWANLYLENGYLHGVSVRNGLTEIIVEK